MPANPTIVVFVESIRAHSIEYYNDYLYIMSNRTRPRQHAGLTVYTLPKDYNSLEQSPVDVDVL